MLLKNQAFTVECKIVDKSNEESVASHTLCLCHTNIHIKKTFDSSMLSLEFAFQFLCKNRSMQKINKQYTHTHTHTNKETVTERERMRDVEREVKTSEQKQRRQTLNR